MTTWLSAKAKSAFGSWRSTFVSRTKFFRAIWVANLHDLAAKPALDGAIERRRGAKLAEHRQVGQVVQGGEADQLSVHQVGDVRRPVLERVEDVGRVEDGGAALGLL